jgi:glyoxylase-like metal-dependent hydrolase (beta-lactamase superfamily II)
MKDIGSGVWAYLQPDGSWGWSNAGLIVDGDQTLLVDTLFDLKLTAEMLADMRRAVPAAEHINTLFNTHHNGDHTFGNQLVEGAEIVATEITSEDMDPSHPAHYHSMMVNAAALGRGAQFVAELFKPFDFRGIELKKPTRTFSDRLELKVGDKTVQLIDLGPAHTRSDSVALVPDDRVVFTGDLMFVEGTPIAWAGPVSNWVAACDKILAMDVDVIVPGHGPICDKQAVRDMKGYLEFVQHEARKRFEKGMDARDAAFDIKLGRYADWGDAERIVVTVLNLYEEFVGQHNAPDVMKLFEQMADYRDKLRAEHKCDGHCNHNH